jgi:hypothetical protein
VKNVAKISILTLTLPPRCPTPRLLPTPSIPAALHTAVAPFTKRLGRLLEKKGNGFWLRLMAMAENDNEGLSHRARQMSGYASIL